MGWILSVFLLDGKYVCRWPGVHTTSVQLRWLLVRTPTTASPIGKCRWLGVLTTSEQLRWLLVRTPTTASPIVYILSEVTIDSMLNASSSWYVPTEVLIRPERWAPQPILAPKSWAKERT